MTEFNISEAALRFSEIRKEAEVRLKAVKAEISEAGKIAIGDVAKAFFERNPSVHGFRWTQYTPYWMDGEECEFSVNTPELEITKQSERSEGQQGLIQRRAYFVSESEKAKAFLAEGEAIAGHQRRVREYSQRDIDLAEKEITEIDAVFVQVGGLEAYEKISSDFEVVARFIMNLEDSDLELIFGDHVQVLVTKAGVEVLKYEHD